jgi:hypothetical protein
MKLHILAKTGLAIVLLASSASAGRAAAPKVRDICLADFQKLCPASKLVRGAVMRCVKTRLDAVSADCRSAVSAAQQKSAARKAARLAAAQSDGKVSAH